MKPWALPCIVLMLLAGDLEPVRARTLELEGNLTQGGLLRARTEPGARVQIDGEPVRVSAQGFFLVGFGRDEKPTAVLEVTYADGEREFRELTIAARRYRVERVDGLPPAMVVPAPEVLERIAREARLVRAARMRNDSRTDYLSGFMWPVQGRISGVYGSQRILNGEPRRPHFGVDIAAAPGTAVSAPADGLVTLVHPDMYFSGATIVLDHGHGLSSAFLHLSQILVEEGARVRRGEIIATVGASGRATGAHLDWRMNLFERRIDPQLLVGPMPGGE